MCACWTVDLQVNYGLACAGSISQRVSEVLINQNEFHLLNEEWRVFCEVWMSQNNFIVYKLFGPLALLRRAEFMAISANARMWNYRFIHRRCQIYFLFYLYGREGELWPDFHASTNSCLVYSVLFVLKHVIFTSIVWPFIFRNFIWLNCRNSNCVTLCAMLQSIRCHFQVWTFTCPFNRINKNSTKNFK